MQATADVSSLPGMGSGLVHVTANGKDRMRLDAQMSHSVQGGDRAAALIVNVSQSLLGSTGHLHVELAANVSTEKSENPLEFELCVKSLHSLLYELLDSVVPLPVCLCVASLNRDTRLCTLRSKGCCGAAEVSSWLFLET